MALQALLLPLVSVFRSAGFNEAFKAIKNLDGGFKEVAKSAGMAAASFAAAGVLQSVTRYMDEAVVVTQKFERNMLALNQVFEANFSGMRRFTKDAQDMGISQGEAAQAAVFLGSVLKQYGLGAGQTAEETQKLIGLSQDLATTYGYDLQEALLSMTALFRGEYDPIEKFGVAMKQSEINALLAARGQGKLTGELLMQAQVQARLDLLYERSSDAMGAFDRATGTLYVSQQKLNAAIQNQQIAFGEPLQGPIATVTDAFAKLTEIMTPLVGGLGSALGAVIELLGSALSRITDGASAIVDEVNRAKNAIYGLIGAANEATSGDAEKMDQRQKAIYALEQRVYGLKVALEQAGEAQTGLNANENISNLTKQLKDAENELTSVKYAAYDADTELKRFRLQAERTKTVIEETAPALTVYGLELQNLGLYSVDAEGNLSNLAGVFAEIETEAQKSNAAEVLKDIGFNAGQIEGILSRPDWAQIFGQISRLAKIAAIDISTIGGSAAYAAAVAQGAANKTLQELLDFIKGDAAKSSGTAPKKPRDAIKELFNELRDEVNKQAASTKLAAMGASEGLIDLILGDKDWTKLWQQIKTGVISLKDLQNQFNNTAAGVKELDAALQDARDEAQAYIDKLQDEKDRLKALWDDAIERANQFKKSIAEISSVDILPTLEKEVGKFEQQIVGLFEGIRSELKNGLESGALFEADYKALLSYANKEATLLAGIARQRDDLANRYSLSKALIAEYQSALTSALNLTSMFSALKKETEKRTVTEITRSVAQLSGSLKQFNVTVTREYEETIDKVTNKTEGLLQGFRDMAAKARSFAENLRKLDEMGLNGALFQQLVEAGVEAGGETAQALIDGGAATISEINGLFEEINTLGAELGEDVAKTMYDTGNEFGDNLLEGIAAKQSELELLARTMAEAFNKEFQAKIKVAAEAPVTAAENAFNNFVVPALEQIDVAGLAQLNAYLANAGTALTGTTNLANRAGIEQKIDIVEMLKKDLLSGAQLDLSGIRSGMTSEDLLGAARATGSTTVNNYYTTIQPGDRLAQNNTVEALQTFANANGSISSWVTL